ncbi:MAG: hypothetical protein IPN92_10470 [Chromatiaceae bacterium]|nr:hypothetical protein [Chromatiaceae bacterium]
MWIFLTHSFLSIVSAPDQPDLLLVRGRIAADIEYVFPEADIITNLGSDYKYSAYLPRKLVAEAIAIEVNNIDYTNFKKSVNPYNRQLAYFDIYARMLDYQISGDY